MKKVIFATLLIAPFFAHSAKSPLDLAVDVGMSNIDKDGESITGLTSRARLNYNFSSFFSAEFDYVNTLSTTGEIDDSTANTSSSMEYNAYSAGAKINLPIERVFVAFLAGGVSYSTVDEEVTDNTASMTTNDSESELNPYAKAGVNIQSRWNKGLNFSLDFTYQPLALDYTATSFSIGASYKF